MDKRSQKYIICTVILDLFILYAFNSYTAALKAARARSVEGHIRNVELVIITKAFASDDADLSSFDTNDSGAYLPYTIRTSLPSSDNIRCENYVIKEGTVVSAEKCTSSNWNYTFDYAHNRGSLNSSSQNTTTNEQTTTNVNKVTIIDFSQLTSAEISTWCAENNIKCETKTEYSNTIAKDSFISQSVQAGSSINEGSKIIIKISLGKDATVSQKNAVKMATSYLNAMAFSRDGLIEQLEYEGFSHDDAVYGTDNVSVNWNEQAIKKAKSYLNAMAFSRDGLIEQLEYEGFTHDQAVYGVDNVSVNWNEQAIKKAKSYLNAMAFSRNGLIEQLEYEGFTHDQAVYGVTQNGL